MTPWRSLLDVLVDWSARWDERNDAAMELASHNEPDDSGDDDRESD